MRIIRKNKNDVDMPRYRQDLKQVVAELKNAVRKIEPLQEKLKSVAKSAKEDDEDMIFQYAIAIKKDLADAIELLDSASDDISML